MSKTKPNPLRKADEDRYDQGVFLRFTKSQKKKLVAKAKQANMPVAIWARRVVCEAL